VGRGDQRFLAVSAAPDPRNIGLPRPDDDHSSPLVKIQGTVVDAAINQIFSHLLQTGTTIAAVVCAFWVMWSGFQYMAAGGNPRQMESAKQGFFNALIGIALVLGARVVAGMIVSAMAGIGG
jgi:hypothetical protein